MMAYLSHADQLTKSEKYLFDTICELYTPSHWDGFLLLISVLFQDTVEFYHEIIYNLVTLFIIVIVWTTKNKL